MTPGRLPIVPLLAVAGVLLAAAVVLQGRRDRDYATDRPAEQVLYVQSPSDKLFDIALSPGYVSDMRRAGIDITYVELPTNKGHMASHADAALWAPILGAFLKRLS